MHFECLRFVGHSHYLCLIAEGHWMSLACPAKLTNYRTSGNSFLGVKQLCRRLDQTDAQEVVRNRVAWPISTVFHTSYVLLKIFLKSRFFQNLTSPKMNWLLGIHFTTFLSATCHTIGLDTDCGYHALIAASNGQSAVDVASSPRLDIEHVDRIRISWQVMNTSVKLMVSILPWYASCKVQLTECPLARQGWASVVLVLPDFWRSGFLEMNLGPWSHHWNVARSGGLNMA